MWTFGKGGYVLDIKQIIIHFHRSIIFRLCIHIDKLSTETIYLINM